MSIATNITRRAGSARYYVRITIPVDLQPVIGKRERWKSLGTTDAREARARAAPIVAEWHAEFAERRRQLAVTPADIQGAAWRHYQEEADRDAQGRAALPKAADVEAVKAAFVADVQADPAILEDLGRVADVLVARNAATLARQFREGREAELRKHLATGETALVQDAADEIIAREGLPIQKGSPKYGELAQGIQRAEIEALQRGKERDAGDWTGKPADPLVSPPPEPKAPTTAAPGETIMELFDAYAGENPANVKQDTIYQARLAVSLFAETVGRDFPVANLDKKAVREWKRLLLLYPVKASETAAFRDKSLRQIVKANETIGKPVISTRTVNRYLSGLGAFCTWLAAHDYIKANPLTDMHIRIDKTRRKTIPFAVDQMNALFRSPLFTGCQSDDKMHRPGNHRIANHRYWLPLVMLYSGARPGEIAQLLTDDVREMHGAWIMHVTTENDDTKSTKTAGSRRVVPIHPELVRLGFVDFCRGMRERGEARLFPEAERNARGQIAAKFSREFGRYLKRIGIKDGRGVSLYSFRHGFIDALRRAEYLDEEFGFLVGHTRPTTTGQYGIVPQGMLRQRVEMIEAIEYPGLELEHLYRA